MAFRLPVLVSIICLVNTYFLLYIFFGFNSCRICHFIRIPTVLSLLTSLLNIFDVAVLLISLFNAASWQTPHQKKNEVISSFIGRYTVLFIHQVTYYYFFKFHRPSLFNFLL